MGDCTHIQELAHQIDFDTPTGLARRWYPRGPHGLVVIDPLLAFGRPAVVDKGVPTAQVFDFYKAEGNSPKAASAWHGLTHAETLAAIEFEEGLHK